VLPAIFPGPEPHRGKGENSYYEISAANFLLLLIETELEPIWIKDYLVVDP
jgi:hypothetical protein